MASYFKNAQWITFKRGILNISSHDSEHLFKNICLSILKTWPVIRSKIKRVIFGHLGSVFWKQNLTASTFFLKIIFYASSSSWSKSCSRNFLQEKKFVTRQQFLLKEKHIFWPVVVKFFCLLGSILLKKLIFISSSFLWDASFLT